MATHSHPATYIDDRQLWRICLAALLLSITLFVVGLVAIYIGDEYVQPAWSEASMPAPKAPF